MACPECDGPVVFTVFYRVTDLRTGERASQYRFVQLVDGKAKAVPRKFPRLINPRGSGKGGPV